ncbi:MAG TPA: DUF992 domain-containing protein [Candidatus Binataceae bacterium]|nr:DUF992 domain-containing protein [Candidatus Binataceae bacterium]
MKSMIRTMTMLAAIALAVASMGSPARAQEASSSGAAASSAPDAQKMTVRTGYLTCHVSSGWGFIFGSSRDVKCAYALQPGYTEYYTGTISKFGADIGYLQSAVILWAVVAPTNNLGQGALAGHYAGATASVAVGVGAGANVLVGGFKNSIALQPVSIEGQNGLNVAAGVTQLVLKFDKAKKAKSD